jgi:hypothetical protein
VHIAIDEVFIDRCAGTPGRLPDTFYVLVVGGFLGILSLLIQRS